jgi:hypothetical protein
VPVLHTDAQRQGLCVVTSAEEIIRRLTDADFLVEIEASQGHYSAFIYERFKRMEGASAGAANLADALNLAAGRWAGRQPKPSDDASERS